jgi:hypothetical protein
MPRRATQRRTQQPMDQKRRFEPRPVTSGLAPTARSEGRRSPLSGIVAEIG